MPYRIACKIREGAYGHMPSDIYFVTSVNPFSTSRHDNNAVSFNELADAIDVMNNIKLFDDFLVIEELGINKVWTVIYSQISPTIQKLTKL